MYSFLHGQYCLLLSKVQEGYSFRTYFVLATHYGPNNLEQFRSVLHGGARVAHIQRQCPTVICPTIVIHIFYSIKSKLGVIKLKRILFFKWRESLLPSVLILRKRGLYEFSAHRGDNCQVHGVVLSQREGISVHLF